MLILFKDMLTIVLMFRLYASYADVDVDVKEATNQVPTLQMISALQS